MDKISREALNEIISDSSGVWLQLLLRSWSVWFSEVEIKILKNK